VSAILVAAGAADLTESADAYRFDLHPGGMTDESAYGPAIVTQRAPTQPPEFQRAILTPGFSIAVDKIRWLRGFFGRPPEGAPRSAPRIKAWRPDAVGPVDSRRATGVNDIPAGLVPTTPGYEMFQQTDSFDSIR
jgi:hypothetical protein